MLDDIKPSGEPTPNTEDQNKQTPRSEKEDYIEVVEQTPAQTNDKNIDMVIDESAMGIDEMESPDKTSGDQPKKSLKERLHLHKPTTKKEWLLLALFLVIILAIIFFVFLDKPAKTTTIKTHVAAKPVSDLVRSTLSGLMVKPSVNKTPVTGVMIENSLYARPQSGLSQAGVVFEALAEGGITRFIAFYQDTAPSNIGPIRSVRPYYLEWALGFDASIAHVGGSTQALQDINTWNVKDLNQSYNSAYYHRITTREAPHNVYTSIAELNSLETKKGYNTINFSGFPRKADSPSTSPTATTINLELSSSDYNVSYSYNKTTNSYARSEGGSAMIDANTNEQISPKVVIAIVVPLSQGALDSSGAYYSNYQVIGSGKAYIFQDGNVVEGSWSKSSNTSQIKFVSENGQPVDLNAGQTWITAVDSTNGVSYTP